METNVTVSTESVQAATAPPAIVWEDLVNFLELQGFFHREVSVPPQGSPALADLIAAAGRYVAVVRAQEGNGQRRDALNQLCQLVTGRACDRLTSLQRKAIANFAFLAAGFKN